MWQLSFKNKGKYLWLLVGLLLGSEGVSAKASFLIWPIYPVIEVGDRAAALWLENTGNETALVQVRVFEWSQQNHQDAYAEQTKIMPSPPVTKIEAGQKQMIRLTRTQDSPAGKELAYRVVVDELPAQFNKDGQINAQVKKGVQFQMRYTIPLFVYGAGLGSGDDGVSQQLNQKNELAKPVLSWRISNKAGKDYLLIRNKGLLHARLSGFKVGNVVEGAKQGTSTFGYVLANNEMHFSLSPSLKRAIQQGQPLHAVINAASKPLLVMPESE